ncbi:MAG: hypothetical protein KF723_06140 [Rhizobiaceae bacterium]|nr:hypothetical protein [Rhizobiaceae bacterium]
MAAGAAHAATLDLAGVNGNAAGCAAEAGAYPHSEDKLILRADAVEGYESYCEFVQVLMSKAGAAVVTLLCGGEGETWINHIVVSPADPEDHNKRQVFQASGDLWGEVQPCE